MRIEGNAVAASDHRGLRHLVRKAEARSKELLAEADAVVLGDTTASSDQRLVCRGIIRFDTQTCGAVSVRVQLPAQSEVERQLRRDAPAVASVEGVLVLEAVHLDELAALPRRSRRPQQESRQSIPVVLERRSVPLEPHSVSERLGVQGCHAGVEVERTARTFAQLRLPVVHQVMDEIEAEPEVVIALRPARIRVERVGLVVAVQGFQLSLLPRSE